MKRSRRFGAVRAKISGVACFSGVREADQPSDADDPSNAERQDRMPIAFPTYRRPAIALTQPRESGSSKEKSASPR